MNAKNTCDTANDKRGRREYRASLAGSFPRRISAIDTIVAFVCIDLSRGSKPRHVAAASSSTSP